MGFSEKRYWEFSNNPLFKRFIYFHQPITGDFERYHYFNAETIFLKNENISGKMEQRLLVEGTTIENAILHMKLPC